MIINVKDIDDVIINESAILEAIDNSVDKKFEDLITESIIQDLLGGDQAIYQSFIEAAHETLMRDEILHEGSTFILDADAKFKKASTIQAMKYAKAANDADYKKYVKYCALRKKYKAKISTKYGARANAEVRKRKSEIVKSSRTSNLINQFRKNIKK